MQFHTSAEIFDSLLAAGVTSPIAQQLSDLAKPAVWLLTRVVKDESEIAIGATKIGGCPDLPPDSVWPIRPGYSEATGRAELYYELAQTADSELTWAKTAEQCQQYRDEVRRRIHSIENPFPLGFLAQINFAEISPVGAVDEDIPRSGVLSIFYDVMEQPWGFDPNERMGYAIQFHDGAPLERLPKPRQLCELPKEGRMKPMACELRACMMLLPMTVVEAKQLKLPDESVNAIHEWWSNEGSSGATTEGEYWAGHQVGGWPTPIQGDMQTKAALVTAGHYCGDSRAYKKPELQAVRDTATEWLLLAQFGTDEEGGLYWGDDGQLYIWIRREDLRARRFDKAHVILQCY